MVVNSGSSLWDVKKCQNLIFKSQFSMSRPKSKRTKTLEIPYHKCHFQFLILFLLGKSINPPSERKKKTSKSFLPKRSTNTTHKVGKTAYWQHPIRQKLSISFWLARGEYVWSQRNYYLRPDIARLFCSSKPKTLYKFLGRMLWVINRNICTFSVKHNRL